MKRLITAAVAIPFALLVTIYAPDWMFALIAGILAALMVDEFLNLNQSRGGDRPGRWFLIPSAAVTASFAGGLTWVAATLIASVLILMTSSVFNRNVQTAFTRITGGLSAILYCSVLTGFVTLLSRDSILVLFAVIWAGDTAAYYGGRTLGRHRLAPAVSPNKTVEGAIAGLLGSILAGTLIGGWRLGEPWTTLAVICGCTAIAGQIGDLAESALKRSAGVKDSSSILPGHGGILDRLDSLLFAAPVFYWLLNA
jgi:phosphatidate cytidylyltransferase